MYITAISYTYVFGHILSIYSTKLSVLSNYLDDIYNLDMSRDMGFPAMWSKMTFSLFYNFKNYGPL